MNLRCSRRTIPQTDCESPQAPPRGAVACPQPARLREKSLPRRSLFFRITTSGMHQAPFANRSRNHSSTLRTFRRRASLLARLSAADRISPILKRRSAVRAPASRALIHFFRSQLAHRLRHQPIPEIAVGRKFAGRNANDRGMSRQVHRVGDDRRRGVGGGRAIRENRDRIRNPQRKTAPAPPAGRNAAHGIAACTVVVPNSDGRSGRSTIPTTNFSPGLRCSAMSPPSLTYARRKFASRNHRRQNLLGHRARHRGHRRDEVFAPRKASRPRPSCARLRLAATPLPANKAAARTKARRTTHRAPSQIAHWQPGTRPRPHTPVRTLRGSRRSDHRADAAAVHRATFGFARADSSFLRLRLGTPAATDSPRAPPLSGGSHSLPQPNSADARAPCSRPTQHNPPSFNVNSIGATSAGVGTYPKAFCGMRLTSAMKVIPPPGHT